MVELGLLQLLLVLSFQPTFDLLDVVDVDILFLSPLSLEVL